VVASKKGKGGEKMAPLLLCEHLTKKYTKTTLALDGVNLSVSSGRVVGLLGPNGSGKTTLLKLVSGLLTPTSGTITVDGLSVGTQTKSLISYMPDGVYLYEWMSVKQLLGFYADFYSDFSTEIANGMLSQLHIDPSAKLKTLSKGNKEKTQLVLTMSRRAKLYLLDEPIGGVDPAARDTILDTILNNHPSDATVIISTHLISDIEQVLDDVIFIRDGQVTLSSSADELRDKEGKSVDQVFREVYKW
jgi:ABC-2 type transport system ATP-binding protein